MKQGRELRNRDGRKYDYSEGQRLAQMHLWEAARVFQAQMSSYGDKDSIKPSFFLRKVTNTYSNSNFSGKDTLNGSIHTA